MFGPNSKINFTFGGNPFCVNVCSTKLDVAKMACNIKKPKTIMTLALGFTHDGECHLCLKNYCIYIHDDPHIKSLSTSGYPRPSARQKRAKKKKKKP